MTRLPLQDNRLSPSNTIIAIIAIQSIWLEKNKDTLKNRYDLIFVHNLFFINKPLVSFFDVKRSNLNKNGNNSCINSPRNTNNEDGHNIPYL